jgi:hypothetical protein
MGSPFFKRLGLRDNEGDASRIGSPSRKMVIFQCPSSFSMARHFEIPLPGKDLQNRALNITGHQSLSAWTAATAARVIASRADRPET